jgi:hypothetical protein
MSITRFFPSMRKYSYSIEPLPMMETMLPMVSWTTPRLVTVCFGVGGVLSLPGCSSPLDGSYSARRVSSGLSTP